jgi:hypothetical protein
MIFTILFWAAVPSSMTIALFAKTAGKQTNLF